MRVRTRPREGPGGEGVRSRVDGGSGDRGRDGGARWMPGRGPQQRCPRPARSYVREPLRQQCHTQSLGAAGRAAGLTQDARHVEWGARRPHAHATSSGGRADHTRTPRRVGSAQTTRARTPRRVGSAKTTRARHVEWGRADHTRQQQGSSGPARQNPSTAKGL